MEIRARQKKDVIILELAGRIDMDAANFVEAIGQCLRDGFTDILCRFEQVDTIDYMGISALVLAYKEVTNNNGRMKFCDVPIHVKNVMTVAGLDRVIDIYLTEEAAMDAFSQDQVIENIQKLQLRRRFKRLPVDIKIELRPKYQKNPVCHKAEIVNLSGIGAYIFGCQQFRLGDEFVLTMQLSHKEEPLRLDVKVVWLPDKHIQPHLYPGIGVEFHNISQSAQQRILEFIDKNLSRIVSEK
ncbi:MAG: STAS domain-containing protein [Candidatus Babeliales bacterium]|nr:PilZ domain-containing protein [Candidatus Omnitrophota bacterium]